MTPEHLPMAVCTFTNGVALASRVDCSCSWRGPDRDLDDPHLTALLTDDAEQHAERAA